MLVSSQTNLMTNSTRSLIPLDFSPSTRKGLVISSSKYENRKAWPPLNTPLEDGNEMLRFLQNDCKFDTVQYISDEKKARIDGEFQSMLSFAQNLSPSESALFFIYYSGHGTLQDADTWGHTVKGEPFNLDEMVKTLATCPNTYVIGFFDCCRQILQSKGAVSSSPTTSLYGQSFTIYASTTKKPVFPSFLKLVMNWPHCD